MRKRTSFQVGRVDVRQRKKGEVYTLVYWVRDLEAKKGWRLKRETLRECATLKKARSILNDRLATINSDNNSPKRVPKKGITFTMFAEGPWKDYLDNAAVKDSTRYSYDSMLKKQVKPVLGSRLMTEITPEDLSRLFKTLRENKEPKYIVNIFGLLNTMFDVAIENNLLGASPLRRKLHRPKMGRKEKATLTPEQIRKVIEHIPWPYLLLLVLLPILGPRLGELLALRWVDIDFQGGMLEFNHSLWRGKLGTPKTPGSVKRMPLPDALVALLRDHKQQSDFTEEIDFVFCRPDGSPLDPDHLRRSVLYPALEAAGIERKPRQHGFHIFRHAAGSILYQLTGDLQIVKELLRHTRITTTSDIYIHAPDSVRADATSRLAEEILGMQVVEGVQ